MSDITSAEIRNTTRSKPAGFCIYCGRTDSLTEEHVIPFALSGNLIIPDASCPSCCNMTSAFEPKVLRGFMHDARIAGNFPTRRRKKRPAAIPIKIKQNKSFESIELSSNDAIGVLQLPMIEKAAFLAGKPPTRGARIYGTQTIVFGRSLEDVAKNLGVEALEFTANIDAYAFVRMLAKIGYCFAVATMGSYSLAEVPVLPLICGKADDGST